MRSQAGLTLIEVVISLALVATVLGSASGGVILLVRSSASANDLARANVLVSGFGDSLKRLEYVDCASPGDYEAAFEAQQDQLDPSEQLLRPSESVVVDSVGLCTAGDPGIQRIDFTVTTRNATRTGQIVKRNPEYLDGLSPKLTACRTTAPVVGGTGACYDTRQDPPASQPATGGDVVAVFDLSATGSTPAARIVQYAFDCDAASVVDVPITTPNGDDPAAVCEYTAQASAQTKKITLTVTDVVGRRKSVELTVTVPALTVPRDAPTPRIIARCLPNTFVQCPGGSANPSLVVSFDAGTSSTVEGRIVEYRWNFGDVNSGASNTATGVTASHTFTRSGTAACASGPSTCFRVTLTVVDDIGVARSTELLLNIVRPGPQPPKASFTSSPQPAVAPQTMSFDASASKDAAGNAVAGYSWNFGGGSSSGVTPQWSYSTPGTYTVTLTVVDSNGLTASATGTVVIGSFPTTPPTQSVNLRMTDARAGGLGIFGIFGTGHFYFAWVNPPASAGDTIRYELEVKYRSGQCFGFNTTLRSVVGGAPGTAQTYDMAVPPPSDVCLLTTYDWRARMGRENAGQGTTWGPWSAYQPWTVTRT